jgi:glycosyltransferase XagB
LGYLVYKNLGAKILKEENIPPTLAVEDQKVSPQLPPFLLQQIFSRLSPEDLALALRHKIVPVAWMPDRTLYGTVGETGRAEAEKMGLRVVSQIAPFEFLAAVRAFLSRDILARATNELAQTNPALSAKRRMTISQLIWLAVIMAWIWVGFTLLPLALGYIFISLVGGLFFLSIIAIRLFGIIGQAAFPRKPTLKLADEDLPDYSVLVPLFRETSVLNQILGALIKLDYPVEKLDIKLILEENDVGMQRALARLSLPSHFEIIVVPIGKPQTKPRALNYALQFAKGELVTIYDAEDVPDRDQLRKAAAQFASGPKNLACIQAELSFYNPNESWLTRQFTLDYGVLFGLVLPALARENLPLPLGGTSNHFRASILRDTGAWDPYNVTEDADLGLRLARRNYLTQVLDSVTHEEATLRYGNWLQQRARWFKGFLQTWFVHMRDPILLVREIGWSGFFVTQAMTFGIIVSALLHPILMPHAIYMLFSGYMFDDGTSNMMSAIAAINLVVMVGGYCVAIFAGHRTMRHKHITGWWFVLATMPVYWLLMSFAAWISLWQFIVAPFHWNKTQHGHSAYQNHSG